MGKSGRMRVNALPRYVYTAASNIFSSLTHNHILAKLCKCYMKKVDIRLSENAKPKKTIPAVAQLAEVGIVFEG